jgi:hypothetical protein
MVSILLFNTISRNESTNPMVSAAANRNMT